MTALTYFTVTGTYLAALKDSVYDVDNDPELTPMSGTVTFTPVINSGDSIPAGTLTPPANLFLVPVKAQLRSGVITCNGATGVKLVANTAVLGLSGNLYYRVDFYDGLTAGGRVYPADTFTFQAPTTATTVDLVTVTPLPGSPAVGSVLPVLSVAGKTGAVVLYVADINGAEATANKDTANGYAGLDSGGKIALSQMPVGAMEYKGIWNASTNSPTLTDGTGTAGFLYRVGTGGSRNLGSGSITFDVGDYVIHNGTTWEKSDGTDAVASVAGLTGAVGASALRTALSVNRASAVDIRDYITSGSTFDLAAVIAAMEAGNGECDVAPGEWVANAYNIGLNEAGISAFTSSGSAPSRFAYKFRGSGKQSRIWLPSGMSSGDYLLIANSTGATTLMSPAKVIFEDIAFTGANSPNGAVLKLNQRSFSANRVYLSSLLYGFVAASGYCDHVHIEHVDAENMTAGGYVYQNILGLGDGLVVDQLIAYGTGAVNVNGCVGAHIRGSLSGWWKFKNSDVTFEENHIEGDGSTSSTPVITLQGCVANIRSGYFQAKPYRPFFSIDDGGTGIISKVTFGEGVRFSQRIDEATAPYGAARSVDVDIVNLSTQSEVTFKAPKSYMFYQSTTQAAGGTVASMVVAPNVTASGMSTIQTALTATPLRVATDCTIRYAAGAWEITPNGRTIPTKAIATPTVSASATTSPYVITTLTAGTYYYKAWVVDGAGRATNPSSETSATLSSGQLPLLAFNTQDAPVRLRVVRGTSAGTYTQWAEVLVAETTHSLYDQGGHIAGSVWQSWSGTPAVPTASGSFNETQNGLLYTDTGSALIRASAAPTVGTWVLGDVCWNSSPASGPPAWICTVAGTPGTWVALVDVSSAQTLTNKTLTTPKIARIFDPSGNILVDTTVAASAVNYPVLGNNSTGGSAQVRASGSDSSVSLALFPKGAAGVIKALDGNNNTSFATGVAVTSAVNHIEVQNAATGNPAQVQAKGTDTNVGINLVPQGLGTAQVNGVEIDTVSGTKALTNKDLTSGTNTFPTLNQNTTGSAAKLTTARNVNGVAFDGTADIQAGHDLPCTQWRVATNRTSTVAGTNNTTYQRVYGSGSISKVGLWVKASSGNISVSVYSNSGVGSAAVPASRQATSGAVACPAIGYAEVSLGATVAVKNGDWLAISADNVTATFAAPLTDGGVANDLGKGIQYSQATAHPSPSTPSSLTATVGFDIALKGIA